MIVQVRSGDREGTKRTSERVLAMDINPAESQYVPREEGLLLCAAAVRRRATRF
jgi:hypothetical protein